MDKVLTLICESEDDLFEDSNLTMSTLTINREIAKEGFLSASLYSNGVIEIIWDQSISTIEVIHLATMQEAVQELGGGKKMPLLFTVNEFLQLSKEAGKYATSPEGVRYTLATAVIIDNLAKKLIYQFYLKFNTPIVPTKSFGTDEKAHTWLTSLI